MSFGAGRRGGPLRELALFAGAGGGILGGKLLGWRTVCAVEFASYPRSVLLARQRDGILESVPIWDDVRTFDGKPWRGKVDVVSGGFPCQDISQANPNANGLDGARSGLWGEMARIICEVRPRFALIENSPMLAIRGLNRVLGDIAGMGYDARWGVFRGEFAGVPQRRSRMFIVAHDRSSQGVLHKDSIHVERDNAGLDARSEHTSDIDHQDSGTCALPILAHPYWTEIFDGGGSRGIDGLAYRVEREKACGNGQIPSVVKLAWETLKP